jgi:hypothetical protein
MGSSVGGLSTIYEIHACHPGSICDLFTRCQTLATRSPKGGYLRIQLFLLEVYPSRPHCKLVSFWYSVWQLGEHTRQLLLQVLEIFVPIAILPNQCAGLGITWNTVSVGSAPREECTVYLGTRGKKTSVSYIRVARCGCCGLG